MEQQTTRSNMIRQYFAAYDQRDREMVETLLSDDLIFTSPHDPHLNKTGYFERCWPNNSTANAGRGLENVIEEGDEVLVRYQSGSKDGTTFRNMEYFKFSGNKIKKIEVYYGSLPS